MAEDFFSTLYHHVAPTELIFKSAIGALNTTAFFVAEGIIGVHVVFNALSRIVVNKGNMAQSSEV